MVGDEINDAPAMTESDIAVAVRSGFDPGQGVAAITLMKETPSQFLDFISLSRQVNTKIRQNLAFSLVYNLIAIPVAAVGMLNLIIAAFTMLVSSLSVTLNILLLVKK